MIVVFGGDLRGQDQVFVNISDSVADSDTYS